MSTATPQNNDPKYYFLAAGYVFFQPQGKPEEGQSAFLSAVFANTTGKVTAQDLGNAQRALMQRLQDQASSPMEVIGVEIANVGCLGHMTPSEFHNVPAPKAPVGE